MKMHTLLLLFLNTRANVVDRNGGTLGDKAINTGF